MAVDLIGISAYLTLGATLSAVFEDVFMVRTLVVYRSRIFKMGQVFIAGLLLIAVRELPSCTEIILKSIVITADFLLLASN